MDCQTIRILAPFARTRVSELDHAESEAFHSHLDDCPDCRHYLERETMLDRSVMSAMHSVPIPHGLQDRILATLRQQRRKSHRRWLLGGASASAAAVLLAFGLFISVRPVEDDLVVSNNNNETYELVPAEPVEDSAHPESTEQWFADHHGVYVQFPARLARRWDFDYLKSQSVLRVDNVVVPVLSFASNDSAADVYLFRVDRFDTAHLPDVGQASAESHHLLGDPAHEPYVALVVIRAGDESDFLRPESRLIARHGSEDQRANDGRAGVTPPLDPSPALRAWLDVERLFAS